MPVLSETADQESAGVVSAVRTPLEGDESTTAATAVSTTNPRAVEFAPTLPRSSIARARPKYVSLYSPVSVSPVNAPSIVSVHRIAVNADTFDTSNTYESMPTLSLRDDTETSTDVFVVSCPSAGASAPT